MSGTPDLAVVLAKLATYDKGRHDLFLNPLTFLLKVAACLRARSEGNGDKVAVGLHQLSDHVNASRFPLRFLVGVTNASLLLSNQHDSTDAPIVKNIVTLQRVLNVFYNVVELKSYVKMVAPAMVAYDGVRTYKSEAIIPLISPLCFCDSNLGFLITHCGQRYSCGCLFDCVL